MAQVVERILGKDEVTSSNLVSSSKRKRLSVSAEGLFFACNDSCKVRVREYGAIGQEKVAVIAFSTSIPSILKKDIVFEMELVKQIEVAIDYILMLVEKHQKSNCKEKEILIAIDRAIQSSITLRSKKELMEGFLATINADTNVDIDWKKFVQRQKETDLSALITEEKLKEEETKKYLDNAFREGTIKTTGTDIDRLMPPVSRFGGGNRAEKKRGIIEKLQAFFEKYFWIA